MTKFLVITDNNVTFNGSQNLRESVWVFDGIKTGDFDTFNIKHEKIHLMALVKGSEPRCRYCKRRLVYHNNGEGADCLKQLMMFI